MGDFFSFSETKLVLFISSITSMNTDFFFLKFFQLLFNSFISRDRYIFIVQFKKNATLLQAQFLIQSLFIYFSSFYMCGMALYSVYDAFI